MKRQRAQSRSSRGRLVARLLAGSWRDGASQTAVSPEELGEIAAPLMTSGAGALGWWRVRDSALRASEIAEQFQQAYRLQSLQAALHERSLKQVIPLLRANGAEPLLVKGWAIARQYPETGLRPYCDLDLCVLADQYRQAKAALEAVRGSVTTVDLHVGFDKFCDQHDDDLFARSRLVRLDDLEVRVLGDEDHLRFLCVHLLRHGAIRPLWLYDIAVLLEARGADFDWEICLGRSRQQADWVACAIGLAHQLLGADVEGLPVARRARALPRWLVPAVLKEWGTPFQSLGQIAIYLRHPVTRMRDLMKQLPRHWPNAIESTVALKGSFNELPRLPFQVGHAFSRTAAMLAQLSRMLWANS